MESENHLLGSPLVSVGIPTLNGGENLIKVVASVLDSGVSLDHIEIIISDNASDDGGLTQRTCEHLALMHPQIRYFRQSEGIGWLPNWNFVMQKATGKYFMWLADDDKLVDGILPKYIDFLEQNPDYALVAGKIDYYDGAKLVRTESGFSQEQAKPFDRVVNYYFRVGDGAMIYGLTRTEMVQKIEHVNKMAMDWHHVAALAFQGKVKQFEYTGYTKAIGGRSGSFVRFAKLMGLNPIWGYFPAIRIGLDIFTEIVYRIPVYKSLSTTMRIWLATLSSAGIVFPWLFYGLPKHYAKKIMHRFNLKTPGDRRRELPNQIAK